MFLSLCKTFVLWRNYLIITVSNGNRYMVPLFTSGQAAQIDRMFAEQTCVSTYELMCRAAQASFNAIRNRWQMPLSVDIFAGSGNNGGDGYQLGRLLLDAGCRVGLFAVGGVPGKEPAVQAYQAYLAANGSICRVAGVNDDNASQLIVDAIFGSGLNRAVSGEALAAMRYINSVPQPKIALDLPSGLSADTGAQLPEAVRAQLSITFVVRKLGLYIGDAKDCCGEVVYDDLQIGSKFIEEFEPVAHLIDTATLKPLKILRQNSHKGDYGHVLVAGGDHGMLGAARLAGEAAMRCGAGLVSVATRAQHATVIAAACPVLMAHAIEDVADLHNLLNSADVIAVGSGCADSPWSRAVFSQCAKASQYKVIDAGALRLLAANPVRSDRWVLTPHPGEAANLLDTDSSTVQADRLWAAREIARKFGGICVLKGSGTIVCSGTRAAVCPYGNVALATAGTGDVLSGVVAALIAQSLPAKASAETRRDAGCWLYTTVLRAVCLHALAAEHCAGIRRRGVLASELMPYLSEQLENVNLYF